MRTGTCDTQSARPCACGSAAVVLLGDNDALMALATRMRCDISTRMSTCFLDCEFTDLLHPELLSTGLVELAGDELYVELDLDTEVGRQRVKASSDIVRWGGV